MKHVLFSVVVLAVVGSVYACSDHTEAGHGHTVPSDEAGGHTSPYPTCQKIIDVCQKYDVGEGEVNDCHQSAHGAKDEASCSAKLADCTRICAAAAADAGGADASDATAVDASDHDGH